MMLHLLRCGILEVIAPEGDLTDEQFVASAAATFAKNTESATVSQSHKIRLRSSASAAAVRSQSASAADTYQIVRLNDVLFLDLNAVAWIIRMHNIKALTHFLKKGYDPTLPVDITGNSSLHCIAAYGVVEMVDLVVNDKRIRYEQTNPIGETAAMIAVKAGNFFVARRLFELRVSARDSLRGKYSAWALAFARKYEKKERNTQTGRYGDDDERYFNTSPDPFYITWYEG
eukprot:scaffold3290_cov165-Ochromonas_danica.AAC.25